jgi:addiction module RelB/DinJ family antitoxin
MSTTITVRMDESVKEEATAVVESLGLDLPTAIRMFTKQIADTRTVPLSLTLNEGLVGESYRQKLDASIAAYERGDTFKRDLIED